MDTLQKIGNDLIELVDGIMDEVYEDDEERYGYLSTLIGNFEEKVSRIAYYIRQLEADNRHIKTEIGRLKRISERNLKKLNFLKSYLQYYMFRTGIDEVEHDNIKVRLQNSPVSVNVYNENEVPKQYFKERVELKLNKEDILKDIKEGKQIPGVALVEDKRHIRIY